jgi:signal transduction histidine kinase
MPLQLPARLLATVVHDLRTPLNVIFLSLRLIEQAVARLSPEAVEDCRVIEENANQMAKMLLCLSEYCKIMEEPVQLGPMLFDPRWLLSQLVETPEGLGLLKPAPVRLEIRSDCPAEVELDPVRARLAVQMALVNAATAADGAPVRLGAGGGPERLVIEVAAERPPPPTVRSEPLRADMFERLFGAEAERRGLDLALAARVSELFGGSARLEAIPGQRSIIVLDWPKRLPAP